MSVLETTELKELVELLMPEIEDKIRAAVRDAMHDVPTLETVDRMIDAKVDPLKVQIREQTNSLDKHLRQSEADLKEAARTFNKSAADLQVLNGQISEKIGGLTAMDASQQGQITQLQNAITTITSQAVGDRKDIDRVVTDAYRLKVDIHGDPDQPHIPSLYGIIKTNHAAILESIKQVSDEQRQISERLASVEGFITTQKTALKALVSTFKAVWRTGRGKLLIGAVVAGLTTLPDTAPFHAIIKSVLGLP